MDTVITQEQFAELLSLFHNREFYMFIERVETIVPADVDTVVYKIFEQTSDEDIIEFFKYVEKNSIFNPIGMDENGHSISDSRHESRNYDKEYFNPAEIIDGLVTICKFSTADKLLVGDYLMDEKLINAYIFIMCDFSSDPDDLVGIDEARRRAQWMVGRGDITWDDVPERLRPDFTGTFTKVGILGYVLGV